MRILVHPNDLVLGGASLNAVQLAASLQHRGHDVLVASPEGDLSAYVEQVGLRHAVTLFAHGRRPEKSTIRSLRVIVESFRPDIVHSWEFGAYLNSFFGLARSGLPQLATVMSMSKPRYLPRTVPLTMGTKALARAASTTHKAPVMLLEPPIDVLAEVCSVREVRLLRNSLGLCAGEPTIGIVSRLAKEMKAEGIQDAIAAVGHLARGRSLQMLIVGSGDGEGELTAAAAAVNAAAGRRVVHMAGALPDPRAAYQLSDIVIGMGSSVIRGMAFAKPCVVVGVNGFVKLVSPETFAHFDQHGMWGDGASADRPEALTAMLGGLLDDAKERQRLGTWGRQVVKERYGLSAATLTLERHLVDAICYQRHLGVDAREAALTLIKTGPRFVRAPVTVPRAVAGRLRARGGNAQGPPCAD